MFDFKYKNKVCLSLNPCLSLDQIFGSLLWCLFFYALVTAIVFFEFLFLGEWKETWGEGWLGRLRGNYKSAWAPMHVTCPRGVTPKSVRPTPDKRPRTAPRSRQRQFFAERWVFEIAFQFLIKPLISFWKMPIGHKKFLEIISKTENCKI